MGTIDTLGLEKFGITHCEGICHNPSYDQLFELETDPSLEGLERGVVTNLGAVAVDTGKYTGRVPRAKYFVEEDTSKDNIWWAGPGRRGSDNKPISEATWEHLKDLATEQLNGKKLFVVDAFAGANPDTRLSVRVVCEVAWQAHFCKNMFIRPSAEELEDFVPDWTILNASKTSCKDWEDYPGLTGEEFVAFNVRDRMTVIGGTWYGGEMKKGIFTMMNYFLPLHGIGSFHCSANEGKDGSSALFFGLSGTGKTTLSTDPHRELIGDDEHGWDDNGVFNFEGGCYAKCIDLSEEKEPEIYHAIKRDALLENVVVDANGNVDFHDNSKTENTRVSYPIDHIENSKEPSRGGHASKIIFLTCDAFGVLPPVSRLTRDQAMYQYLAGYTAKVAGTEVGITEPKATFSACFGAPFLLLHPTSYAEILGRKMDAHGSTAYLVNTGWVEGRYGEGHRIDLKTTRAIITAILDGTLDNAECETLPVFGLHYPVSVPEVDDSILNPRNSWNNKDSYDETARELAGMFIEAFQAFTDTDEGRRLESTAGPQID